MKYLTHNFLPHTLIDPDGLEIHDAYCICETCRVIIISSKLELELMYPPYISNYWMKTLNKTNSILTMNCNEVIIKTSLE
jgi:hypothetical protein